MEIDEMALGQEGSAPEASGDEGIPNHQMDLQEEQPQSHPLQTEGTDKPPGEEAQTPHQEVAEEAEVTAASPEVSSSSDASPPNSGDHAHPMEALLESEFDLQPLKRGDIVHGTIVRASRDEILIDVGGKTEGVVPANQIERLDDATLDGLKVGTSVMAYVLTPEDRSGNILLSLSRAAEENDWIEAEQYMADSQTYEGIVTGFNKGGLIVRFGQLRGFVPSSQVSIERRRRSVGNTPEERWASMVDEPMLVKVIEVDRGRNRLILSERAAAKESRLARKASLLAELEVGQILNGRVISLTDFGAFVDLGGADGLIHLSELSWGHVTHPKEVLAVGDKVEVEVISLDRESQRIGLSMKRRQDDPWVSTVSQYEVGQLVQGTITKLTKFGAFARLVDSPEIEGLIHISELSEHRVTHPREVVEEGQIVTLRIVRIETDKRRIGLSLKRVDSEAYIEADWQTMLEEVNLGEGAESAVEVTPDSAQEDGAMEADVPEDDSPVEAEESVQAEGDSDLEEAS